MRILGRYVFREILASALIGTLLATGVIFLQGSRQLFELLVRSAAADGKTVAYLFSLAMPPLLPLTVPFGVLVGILIGLGRLSSDGEITALRAAGVSSRRLIVPVMTFALLALVVAATASIKLTPLAARETYRIANQLAATQLTAEIQPRVFDERFPNTILYVGDVRPGPVAVWRNVFMADLTDPGARSTGLREKAEGPLVTVAREAVAVPDLASNRIQLSLRDASSHEMGKDAVAYDIAFPRGEQALQAREPTQVRARPFSEMSTSELRRQTTLEARIELHRRLALPLACLALALVGIPLGISSRKGGKGSGYVTAIFLAFFCYHLSFISLVGLAKQGALVPELAVWLPNLAFGLGGLVLIARLERPDDRDIPAAIRHRLASGLARIKRRLFPSRGQRPLTLARLPLFPQIVDTYILSRFLFYFALLLATFVTMTEVYNFFELLSDIVRNRVPLAKVFTYLAFLTPKLIYDTLPISVLVAVLVTFGVLSKHNEVIAFKACGMSLTRLATPIFIASGVLSAGLFAFDHYYVPEANRKQDALRNEIKGRAVQTYLNPERKWIFGEGSRIYYYKHFDMENETMVGVMVFELDPDSFRLLRQTSAESAHWQHSLRTWIFENGWTRDFRPRRGPAYDAFQVRTFPELTEPPRYFLKEVKQDKQMNFRELERYIQDLQQSGFDTVKLRVQFYRKFSVPLFALIMALISVPFSFLIGSRGAMAGIGVSIGIAIGYWGLSLLFEQIGNFNQLPPAFAAWSPNALFALSGLYMMLRLRS